MWREMYKKLNLCGGRLVLIQDDDEDMLRINYKTGKIIDVGYVKEENTYYITVINGDTIECWNHPLLEIRVKDKANLLEVIQKVIYDFNG